MVSEIVTPVHNSTPQENIILQFEHGLLSYSQAEKRIRLLTPDVDMCEYWVTELQICSDLIKYYDPI